ncbi:MAG TPA: hypothetical protein PK079_23995 [Leptospiraceae bacterium]|nr:hypothetical protein [Leptospiraceae bacterium]HMW08564.1 hypothetical protein [Leptospiraceae bacterium]HMZ66493.1 hypothetical protein [Leptospiraceae bacterium]HNA10035.1 hypothetical protein [Leptospiraceae bacterium]HNC00246.1 hypothetical protein [Leptospiraceae bacterium]
MKTSEIAVNTINQLNEVCSNILNVDSVDEDYLDEVNFAIRMLKKSIFNHIVKYEYSDFYLRNRSKKMNAKKFIDNPEKTLELFQNPKIRNSKKK